MQLTIRDAARMLGLPERALARHVEKGECPFRRMDGRPCLDQEELAEWAAARGLPIDFAAGGEERMPSLAEALEAGGIVHGVEGADKAAVLRRLVEAMPLPPEVDAGFLHGVLLAREALGSTALGDGVAVPHPRSPILLRVPRALATLCYLATPIDFGALDGRPVHALFSMVSPTTRIHLHLLSRLAFALRDPAFKDCVARRAPADDVLAAARRIDGAAAAG